MVAETGKFPLTLPYIAPRQEYFHHHQSMKLIFVSLGEFFFFFFLTKKETQKSERQNKQSYEGNFCKFRRVFKNKFKN